MSCDDKPQGRSNQFVRFKCNCGKINIVSEFYVDWYDLGDGDSLDFHCDCGKYYKKIHRIPEEVVISSWYEEIKG